MSLNLRYFSCLIASARAHPVQINSLRIGTMPSKNCNGNSFTAASIMRASGIVTILGVISKLLGFIRETVIAAVFGATGVTDSYLVAYMLPSILFVSIGAAIVTVFIPVYTEVNSRQSVQSGFALINKFGTAALFAVGVIVILGEIFAPLVVGVLAPGFSESTFDLTVSLTRILTPVMILLTLTYLATAALNAQRHFTVPAAIGLPYNIIIIAVTLLLGRTFGIHGLAFGTIIAIASQFVIQLPPLYKSGYRIRLDFDFADPNLRKIGLLLGPVILSSTAAQINVMVDRILASGLAEGSIAALNFANRVNSLPISLFVSSIITVMYPSLSEHVATGNVPDFTRHLGKSLGIIAFLTFPITVGFIVLAYPLTQILFERGAFDASATHATAIALIYYAIGIAPIALSEMLKRGFWAVQDTKTPMYNTFIAVGSNIIFNLILVRWMGHGGLALGTSLAAIVSTIVLFWHMRRRVTFNSTIWASLAKVFVNTGLMAVYCYWAWEVVASNWLLTHTGLLNLILAVGGVVITGAGFYFLGAYLLKIDEMLWSLNLLSRFMSKLRIKFCPSRSLIN